MNFRINSKAKCEVRQIVRHLVNNKRQCVEINSVVDNGVVYKENNAEVQQCASCSASVSFSDVPIGSVSNDLEETDNATAGLIHKQQKKKKITISNNGKTTSDNKPRNNRTTANKGNKGKGTNIGRIKRNNSGTATSTNNGIESDNGATECDQSRPATSTNNDIENDNGATECDQSRPATSNNNN